MIATLRAALVIARRDYIATVWSRAFLLFLIGPMFPILFGILFGAIGARMNTPPPAPSVAVIADPAEARLLNGALDRLRSGLDPAALPRIEIVPANQNPRQAEQLLEKHDIIAVLSGLSDKPILRGPPDAISGNQPPLTLLLDEMRRDAALNAAAAVPSGIHIETKVIGHAPKPEIGSVKLARGGQVLLLILTMILAGMLLSNLLEEKSNKVIEVLAAAVPVDAIFVGKLVAMLGMSLTGIAIWGTVTVGGVAVLAPGFFSALAPPAVGWPLFVLLGVLYFMASYLLLGALFLGIGAQAGSVREVQTMSMPITMGQLVIFALASAAVDNLDSGIGYAGILFPWSSPFVMLARGAMRPELWPHLLAMLWQGLWLALIIRVSARLFRRSVLKSGRRGFWRSLRAQ